MLKNIPKILTPDLIKILMEMGHGDDILIADGNFPSAALAKRLIRLDGHNVPEILEAILKFFPLDTYVDLPVAVMQIGPGDDYDPVIWKDFQRIIRESGEPFTDFDQIEKPSFYERSKNAYAIIATSEMALYANIILKKGVLT